MKVNKMAFLLLSIIIRISCQAEWERLGRGVCIGRDKDFAESDGQEWLSAHGQRELMLYPGLGWRTCGKGQTLKLCQRFCEELPGCSSISYQENEALYSCCFVFKSKSCEGSLKLRDFYRTYKRKNTSEETTQQRIQLLILLALITTAIIFLYCGIKWICVLRKRKRKNSNSQTHHNPNGWNVTETEDPYLEKTSSKLLDMRKFTAADLLPIINTVDDEDDDMDPFWEETGLYSEDEMGTCSNFGSEQQRLTKQYSFQSNCTPPMGLPPEPVSPVASIFSGISETMFSERSGHTGTPGSFANFRRVHLGSRWDRSRDQR